jgi:uncharacterized LabA/DUF88 family protein
MRVEPNIKRAIAFIDGQNLFYAAKESFGYSYPNYDVTKLATSICGLHGWECLRVQFYTGVPEASDNHFWNHFWVAKLAAMGSRGVRVFSRKLRYRNQTVKLPDGTALSILVGQEKGVDIRIALDIVHSVRANECDVALVFSQDHVGCIYSYVTKTRRGLTETALLGEEVHSCFRRT